MKNICFPLVCAVSCAIGACSPMDEYKKIAGDKEHSYPAKITNVVVKSGKERVVVTGEFLSDPMVTKCMIFWEFNKESIEVPVDMSGGPQTLDKEIALAEKSYTFAIYTYDDEGNRSAPVTASGKSYGDKYRSTISNRLIKSTSLSGGTATITWYPIDTTLGAQKTVVEYTDNSDDLKTAEAFPSDAATALENYKVGSDINYYTLCLPDPLCLDLFKTDRETVKIH